MIRPYRPSSGTEGMCFQERWCEQCKRDQAYQESGGEEEGCPILAATMAYRIDDPKYPKEWIYDDGDPICEAFDDIHDRITRAERAAQVPLPL